MNVVFFIQKDAAIPAAPGYVCLSSGGRSEVLKDTLHGFALSQDYGADVQKVIDTVNDDCYQCRAAAARR